MHQSKVHQATPLETFVQGHGPIFPGISHDKIGDKVMRHGQCERHVDGIAEQLERELNLGQVCYFISEAIDSDQSVCRAPCTVPQMSSLQRRR